MAPSLTLLPLAAPALLLLAAMAGSIWPGPRPRQTLAAGRWASLGSLALAAATALAVALLGPATSPLLGSEGVGVSLRLDALSAVMFLLVAFVGAVVVQFSRNYLDGDPRQGAFIGGLCLTLAAVMLLVLAGNLVQLWLAWIGTSLALHRLLLFRGERPGAQRAARKKFVMARIGDLALLVAVLLVIDATGTTDIAGILADARGQAAAGHVPATLQAAAALLVLAAMLKSAQFPTHGWLVQVMETPTPVSALLHAGIVNAGGFLVIRFADLVVLTPGAMHVLAVVGGVTALIGAAVMLAQPAIKTALAWSTVSQMGFMLMQCGLGAFAPALLHIVAHSLYKAHAFLSAGGAAARIPPRIPAPAGAGMAMLAAMLIVCGAVFWAGGSLHDAGPGALALGFVLVLGLWQLVAGTLAGGGLLRAAAGIVAAAALSVAYLLLQAGTAILLATVVPPPADAGAAAWLLAALVMLGFLLLATGQTVGCRVVSPERAARLRIHVANGFYADLLLDRVPGFAPRAAAQPAERTTP